MEIFFTDSFHLFGGDDDNGKEIPAVDALKPLGVVISGKLECFSQQKFHDFHIIISKVLIFSVATMTMERRSR